MNDHVLTNLTPQHTALRALFIVALQRGVLLKPEDFVGFTEADTKAAVLGVMGRAGLEGRVRDGGWRELVRHADVCPFMALLADDYWVVVTEVGARGGEPGVTVLDPRTEKDGTQRIARADFVESWTGTFLLCRRARRPPRAADDAFGLAWFVPEILRHRAWLRDVAIAALLSTMVGFATPLMFQVLIDKVIGHRATDTLTAVIVMFCTLTLFDAVFAYTRQYGMLFVTSKIDARLAAKIFAHLLSLPLPFFEATTAGILVRHLQQTDTIRHFLTGRLFQTALDAVTLPITLSLLVFYSGRLTLVVLAFAGLITLVIGLLVPIFRRQLEQLYRAEGTRQGHLVETIHGIRTVKTLALEPLRITGWNDAVADGITRRAIVGRIGAIAGVITQTLEKFMQLAVLAIGATSVFDGSLSVGALVAFNMISGRVSGPLVQIVGLVNEYQEVSLAVKMLGTVMRHPPEQRSGEAGTTPEITGALSFDQVIFRYPGATSPALDRVSFEVEPGRVVGIVGRSGSGKTTLTRLIQGIQIAEQGTIRIDGHDIRAIDLAHLRRNIGVVLQENFLFRGTIRDNIAAARPDLTLGEIAEAARMAGAAEFIERLPAAYDTFVEENGANFSGGQRQRIAIARALVLRPRLLIFDEATSALDPESEAIVQTHLNEIAQGRTLVIVSHRLTSLTGADAILVLDQGSVVDYAPHAVLLQRCEVYQRLWVQQTSHFL